MRPDIKQREFQQRKLNSVTSMTQDLKQREIFETRIETACDH